jgi:hypothetical protein
MEAEEEAGMEFKLKMVADRRKSLRRATVVGVCAAMSLLLILSAAGQQTGPIHPPPPPPTPLQQPTSPKDNPQSQGTQTSASTPGPTSGNGGASGHSGSTAALAPPPMPIPELIQKFATREDALREARGNYTYTQKITVKDYGPGGEEGGQFQQTSDIVFTPEGKRYEKVTFAPQGSLQFLIMTAEDFKDIEDIQPFVLTTEELSKYNITYVKHEALDELTCYLFDVSPKQVEKNKAYFEGRIWVEDQGFNIVKSYGRAMHGIKVKKNEDTQLFPRFETLRENITADLWFPTYTHADDILHFKAGDVRIVQTIRYTNYKYFGSTIKISPTKPQDHEELREPPKP